MKIQELEIFLKNLNQPQFRLKQILQAIFKDGIIDFNNILNLPKNLREELAINFQILPFKLEKILTSKKQDSIKAALKTQDNFLLETVLMRNSLNDYTVCVSSQIGCPLACGFCATGASGFKRDLQPEEIYGQVLFWLNYLKTEKINSKISNMVYMGMGEPFLNWINLKESLDILTSPKFFNFGDRSISVSTAGIPDGIIKLAENFEQINLALSLHSAIQKKREEIMPIAKKYSLNNLKKALEIYLSKTRRKIFLEYIMLKNINDQQEDAQALIDFINSFEEKYLLHINLIPYNSTGEKFEQTAKNNLHIFKQTLENAKIKITIRQSLGADIQSACGQLAGS